MLLFIEFVFLVFGKPVDDVVDRLWATHKKLLPRLKALKETHEFKIGGPSTHNLAHLIEFIKRFGHSRNFSAQRDEARHGVAKRDVRFVQKRILSRSLMEREAIRIGLRSALHGMRWDDNLLPNPNGKMRAGVDWRNRLDPHSSTLLHPILRGISHYQPLSRIEDADDSGWMFKASARRNPSASAVQLVPADLESMAAVYHTDGLMVDADEKLPQVVAVAKSATIGNQTYQAGDDIRLLCKDDRSEYVWFARIDQLVVHEPVKGKRAVWLWVKYFRECLVARKAYFGTLDRRICTLDTARHLVSPLVIISPVAAFHYCRVSEGDLKDGSAEAKRREPSLKLAFADATAIERHGTFCGMTGVKTCRAHSIAACSSLACAGEGRQHVLRHFVHDVAGRNLWAIEINWTGY